MNTKTRCGWVTGASPLEITYHDSEWGLPVYDDERLFEMLSLEGAQAGLSWKTILQKREGYRKAFFDFDLERVAKLSDARLEKLSSNTEIVRHKQKILSVRNNARCIRKLQQKHGSFAEYLWGFVDHRPIQNSWRDMSELPNESPASKAMSKELKALGFNFVGPTICYAFMQAVGMVNDHTIGCFRHGAIRAIRAPSPISPSQARFKR